MMEKDQPDSMATVQMTKADYAASEVYSTTSEPPPVSWHSEPKKKKEHKKHAQHWPGLQFIMKPNILFIVPLQTHT